MATPKQHIEEIRKTKFSIGGEMNPLTEDLHQAVKNLSAELYAKDVHFFMELIQNAEDNEYSDGVNPSLEFVITSRDVTQTGALATLLIFNNEKGFSAKNIESICSVGRSTKKGNRKRGYIGEKGIGFKSVFLITAQPYIFSNGYKIRFNEEPCPHCNVGYIVPEWVEENPTLLEMNKIYGAGNALPTTIIVLPLRPDKVKPVKQQLSSIHPEVLLFLSKIKKLSVKEDNEDPRLNTVNAISISSETNFVTRKNIDAESYTLHLSAEEKSNASENDECSYYMWKQKFPVKQENRVEKRMEVEEWVITLAFPFGQRLHRGMSSPGVYAFLPTEMVTNLPFIIQADFLLASSRETILLDNKWNQGILACVPTAFVSAFISLVKTTENAPISSLPCMFEFLPINSSAYSELNDVRKSIRLKLVEENIVPCESYTDQKFFHKPREVGRLMPDFWNILDRAREKGVSLHNLSSHGRYILSCSFDRTVYDHILNFLGVEHVNIGWYAKCIQSSNIVLGVSEDVYLELLLFLAENWCSCFKKSYMGKIPLLKYVGFNSFVSLCSVREVTQENRERCLLISRDSRHASWLIDWNKEFGCLPNMFFMPKSTQEAIWQCSKKNKRLLKDWAKVAVASVYDYANLILESLSSDGKLVIAFVHFLYHSHINNYMSEGEVKLLCGKLPLQDNYGRVSIQRKGVLVPASGSNWVELIDSNPWREEGYIELGEVYLQSGCYANVVTSQNQLLHFLKTFVGASDIPDLSPPNAVIPTVAAPLTKSNALLLLYWIKNLTSKGFHMPERFLRSIKEGCWLKTSLSGSPGYKQPSQSFLLTSSYGSLLQNGSVFVDIPLIDLKYYGEEINKYKQELKAIGVMFEYEEACEFIGKHLMSLAASYVLTKANVFSILNFIKFLRENILSTDKFINSIKEGKWMKTSLGYGSPVGSVLYDHGWKAASQISDIPFIDKDYYGEEIVNFQMELQLLGVVVGFNQSYQLVSDCLKSSSRLTSLTVEAIHLILECVRFLRSSEKLVKTLRDANFLKTTIGYKSPSESFLFDPEWGSLLQVFNCFPLINTNIYGSSILSYAKELRQLGVKVDFEEAAKAFTDVFRNKASSIGKQEVLLFLACYRKLSSTTHRSPDLKKCIDEVKWLRTRLGDYRSPKECILFGPGWEPIAPIALLPFLDDTEKYYGKGIHEYKKELKSMGVVIEFKKGVKFITIGLYLPADPHVITRANVLSMLECVRIIQQEQKDSLPESFMKMIQKKWIKTCAGYRSPGESLLFGPKWGSFLQQNDGPFIDKEFYGSAIMAYSQELNAIGVIVDAAKGGQLLSSHLCAHSDFTTIVRIYNYLSEVKWEPSNEAAGQIWIPNGSDNGKWVSAGECVLHDKDGLFGGSILNVLEKHYERKLLCFFSSSLEVKSSPSVDDYCKLWKIWETSGCQLSNAECCAFWGYITKHWSSKTERTLADSLVKLPVNSGLEGTLLFNKHDVFIADDLQLKDLLDQSSPHPIFVWYPQSSLPALPRIKLLEIYRKIGVRTISESVKKEELSIAHGVELKQVNPSEIFVGKVLVKLILGESVKKEELSIADGVELKQVNPSEVFIGKVLVKLILGVLAGPSINMEAKKRHEAVKCLINLTVLETVEPIAVSYSLPLSSGKVVSVKANRMIRWDREKSIFFMQKMDKSGGYRSMLEYATYFSEVIAEGVLWENEEFIYGLSELIKLAYMMEFNEEAVGFLMKNKNLLIFAEDVEFLSSTFPSDD